MGKDSSTYLINLSSIMRASWSTYHVNLAKVRNMPKLDVRKWQGQTNLSIHHNYHFFCDCLQFNIQNIRTIYIIRLLTRQFWWFPTNFSAGQCWIYHSYCKTKYTICLHSPCSETRDSDYPYSSCWHRLDALSTYSDNPWQMTGRPGISRIILFLCSFCVTFILQLKGDAINE